MSDLSRNLSSLAQSWPKIRKPSIEVPQENSPPYPSAKNMRRILCGDITDTPESVDGFLSGGRSLMISLMNIAEVYGEVGDRVLEWGVGCARIARHIPHRLRKGFRGVDVDAVNIDWCSGNLPWGKFEPISPGGKIKAKGGHFSLSYGWSVMTHLSEDEQDHWLRELNRVTDGLLVISVHGFVHASKLATWLIDEPHISEWVSSGFRDSGVENKDIADQVPEGYYRDVAHCPAYIVERWSKIVDVVDIIPGGFGEFHDAVVCRTRKT